MKKKIVIAVLALLFVGIIIIPREIEELSESNETITEQEIYQVKDDEVALVYNYSLQKAKGIYKNGVIYIPLNWTRAILNDKFYYSEDEKLLIYTLPTEIVYANFETLDNNRNPLLVEQEGRAYISMETVKAYTDVWTADYIEGDIKKIYINNTYGEYEEAYVKSKSILRIGNSKMTASIENFELEKDEKVTIIEKNNDWYRIATENGLTGYIKSTYLKNVKKSERISHFNKPVYTAIQMDEKVVLGWHQVTTETANKGLNKVAENTKGLNVISPTWFKLSDNNGNYTSIASKTYVDSAHKKGLKVWVLIDNFSDEVKSATMLASTKNRQNLITSLINDSKTYGFDGINLDFESLTEAAGPHYIQFIRELSVSCRNNGIVLSVDVAIPASYNMHYERTKIAEVVDYVINMGYDEHYSGSDEGSSASIGFVRNAITDSLKEVPKEKLINAVPVYTRVWTKENEQVSSKALGMVGAAEWVKENNIKLSWDEKVGQYVGETTVNNTTKYIWMEDERSMKLKIDAIKEADLAGVAVWKLGLEPKEIWEIIDINNK